MVAHKERTKKKTNVRAHIRPNEHREGLNSNKQSNFIVSFQLTKHNRNFGN